MKTTVSTKEFKDALGKVCMVGVNKTSPVSSNVFFSNNNKTLKLITTDLYKSIELTIDASGDDLVTLLPRRTTSAFLCGGNGQVSIEVKDKDNVILNRDDIGKLSLVAPNSSDFPPTPEPSPFTIWSVIDAKWFCQMLTIAIPACATENSRPILTGVYFADGRMASADGFRLVSIDNDKLKLGLEEKNAIIPAKSLALVKRLFSNESEISIGFDIAKSIVYFKTDKILMTSQTIQGTFPKYEQLIPSEFTHKLSLSSPLMTQRLNMIDSKSLVSGIVRLEFQRTKPHNEDTCSITTSGGYSDCGGSYSLTMPVKLETKEASKIALNYNYLSHALKHFSMCDMELTSISSPAKFTGDIEGLTIMVMPMFVQWE